MRIDGRSAWTTFVLTAALSLVFLLSWLPHVDIEQTKAAEDPSVGLVLGTSVDFLAGRHWGNPNPTHWDEVVHLHYTGKLLDGGSVVFGEGIRGAVHERGYHVFLGEVEMLTGLPPATIAFWLPPLWSVFSAFALYAVLRPHPAAPYAAAAFALIPTTTRFLGPAFMVPVAFVLPWILAVVLLEREAWRGPWQTAILVGTVAWAFLLHLIGGFAAFYVVLVLLALRAFRGEPSSRLVLGCVLAVVSIGAFLAWGEIQENLGQRIDRETYLHIDATIFTRFGVLPLVAWAGATAWILYRPRREDHAVWALAFASLTWLTLIAWTVRFDPTRYATYDRWHLPFLYTACIGVAVAAWALGEGARTAWRRFGRAPRYASPAAAVMAIAFVVASFAMTLPARAEVAYLHPVSDEDAATVETLMALGPEHGRFAAQRHLGVYAAAISGREWATSKVTDLEHLLRADVTVVLDNDHPPEFRRIGHHIAVLDLETRDALRAERGLT